VLLFGCRYLALLYAIGLALAETILNSNQDHWQYTPLWIIDYVIAAGLLIGFWATRRGRYVPVLMSAYALSTGVLYMAFFTNFDPELPEVARGEGTIVALIGFALILSVVGLVGSAVAWLGQERSQAR
jgi:hypothetical protein